MKFVLKKQNIIYEIRESFSQLNKNDKLLFKRFTFELENRWTPLDWIIAQSITEKFYWNDKTNDLVFAASGVAWTSSRLNNPNALNEIDIFIHSNARVIGSFGFFIDSCLGGDWQCFDKQRLYLPRFEIHRSGEQTQFSINFFCPDLSDFDIELEHIIDNLNDIKFPDEYLNVRGTQLKKVISEFEIPSRTEWSKLYSKAEDRIKKGILDKVVLAKNKRVLSVVNGRNDFSLVKKLLKNDRHKVVFGFQVSKSSLFLGSSPEFLYERHDNKIESQVIAGTRKRSTDKQLDNFYEDELISSGKELQEHQFVKSYFEQKLGEICTDNLNVGKTYVSKYSKLQHLCCSISGELQPSISDIDIIKLLHPSPAVCGVPKQESLDFLYNSERINRGLYASPIGWFTKNEAKFMVGIRSCLIQFLDKKQLHDISPKLFQKGGSLTEGDRYILLSLYAGAGIVCDSTEECEWQEINDKINSIQDFFLDGESR